MVDPAVVGAPVHDFVMDGVRTVVLGSPSSWDVFHRLASVSSSSHLWRGQREDHPLRSTFDRHFRITDARARALMLETHVARFLREMDLSHPGVLDKRSSDEVWALGQHYRLRTPLLDWTTVPDVAAYFALEERSLGAATDCYRYIYALRLRSVPRLKWKRKRGSTVLSEGKYVRVVRDVEFLGSRIQAQHGVFTMALNGEDIEANVRRWGKKRPNDVSLVRFLIPTADRDSWLRKLNALPLPINGVTLQLDLHDAIDRCR